MNQGRFHPASHSPLLYGHRGARALAPENTLSGFKIMLGAGVHFADLDVIVTGDDHLLVSHDLLVNPDLAKDFTGTYVNQNLIARELSLCQLQKFNVGQLNPDKPYSRFFPHQQSFENESMPSLAQAIEQMDKWTDQKISYQIEMKTDPTYPNTCANPMRFAELLGVFIQDHQLFHRVEVQAFDWQCLTELQKRLPGIKTAYLTSRENERGGSESFFDPSTSGKLWTAGHHVGESQNSIPRLIKKLGGSIWGAEDAQLTEASLYEAQSIGLRVVVWSWPEKLGTAFDDALTEKMIDWGVDGIITDDPVRLNRMLLKKGLQTGPIF